MRRLWSTWNAYWFSPAPLLDLAVVRILAVGGQLLISLCLANPVLSGHFLEISRIPHMYEPLALVRFFMTPFGSEYFPPLAFIETLYWLTLWFGISALLGLFTNLSLIIFALGTAFLQAYSYSFGDFHHSEAMMAIALAMLALSPCGSVLSLDNLRRRLRQVVDEPRFAPFDASLPTSEFACWPIRALVVLFSLVYLSAAYFKFKSAGLEWLNGHTLQYYLLQDGFRWDRPLALWLADHNLLARLMSAGCLVFEGGFFLACFFPALLPLFVICGVALHAGIYVLMKAGFWEYMFLLPALLPWSRMTYGWRVRFPGRHSRFQVLYDGECGLCLRSMTFLDSADWTGCLQPLAFQENEGRRRAEETNLSPEMLRKELHVIEPNGELKKGFFAFRTLSWRLPPLLPLAPLLYLPGMSWAGPRLYRLIADNRKRFTACETGSCRI